MKVEGRDRGSRLEQQRSPFTWVAESTDSVLIVRFQGDLDLVVANDCEAGLAEPLAGPERLVVLDLGDVSFADSSGLRVLIGMKRKLDARAAQLLITHVSQPVKRVIDASGLADWFQYHDGDGSQQ